MMMMMMMMMMIIIIIIEIIILEIKNAFSWLLWLLKKTVQFFLIGFLLFKLT